jgi:putative endonuclease
MEARPPGLSPDAVGRWGEAAAARYLESQGWRIVARRFRVRGGEIDLVAEKGGIVAFVEVKTRAAGALDDGAEAVGMAKRRRVARAAGMFLVRQGWTDRPCRFDLVQVRLGPGAAQVRHLPGAFDLEGIPG